MFNRSWLRHLGLLLAGLVLVVGLVACDDDDEPTTDTTTEEGSGGGGDPASFTLGYVTTEQHPYGTAVNSFIDEVTSADSSLSFETLPTYSGGDLQLLADVRSGTVDAATVSSAVWDTQGVNAFQALQAPFLITNYDIEREVLTGDVGADMLAAMEEATGDLVGIAIHEGGLRSPIGREKALTTPADFEGLKIRAVQSNVMSEGLKALGAEPSPIALPEVYQALQNGTVDGMEANTGLVAGQKYYEVANFFTGNVVFWPFPTVLVMNKAKFDSLSEDQQQAIRDAGANVAPGILDVLSGGDAFAQSLANCGMQFVDATDADRAALQEAGETAYEALSSADSATGDFIDRILEIKGDDNSAPAITVEAEEGAACELGG